MCGSPDVSLPNTQERLVDGAATLGLLARQDLAAAEAVAAVLEAPQLFDLMRGLMQQVLLVFRVNPSVHACLRSGLRPALQMALTVKPSKSASLQGTGPAQ